MAKLTKEQLNSYLGEEEAKKYYKALEKYHQKGKKFKSFNPEIFRSPIQWSVKNGISGLLVMFLFVLSFVSLYPFFLRPNFWLAFFNHWVAILLCVSFVGATIESMFFGNYALFDKIEKDLARGIEHQEAYSTKKVWRWRVILSLPPLLLLATTFNHYHQERATIPPFDQAEYEAFEEAIEKLERPNPLQVLATGYQQPKTFEPLAWYETLLGKERILPYDSVTQKGVKHHFIKNSNSTISDNTLGLMWQNDEAMYEHRYTGHFIKGICKKLELEGYDDWRVPTAYELISLVNFNKDRGEIPLKRDIENTLGFASSTNFEKERLSKVEVYFVNSEREGPSNLGFEEVPYTRGAAYVRCVRTLKEQKPIRRFDFIADRHRQVVLDRATSLMWQNEPYSQEEAVSDNHDQELGKMLRVESAFDYCNDLELGGYNDWYLPNIMQLMQIYKHFEYPKRETPFTKITEKNEDSPYYFYQSSTDYPRSTTKYVRCVRDAKVWKWDEE